MNNAGGGAELSERAGHPRDVLVGVLKRAIEARFSESDWGDFGYATGTQELVFGHPRLLRSLRFKDPDYGLHVYWALRAALDAHPDNLRVVLALPKIQEWLREGGPPGLTAAHPAGTGTGADPALLERLHRFGAEAPGERSVFVMMRYREGPQYQEIEDAIVAALRPFGLRARLAKDRAYADDLWENVRTYMHGCGYGVAVFEQIDEHSFNPNVALELGYMYALGRRCLLLKERRLPALPTDVVGKLYRTFDSYRIAQTVGDQVTRWLMDDLLMTPA